MTVSEFFTEMMSVSPLAPSFLERGRLRIATRILGCSIFKILIITPNSIIISKKIKNPQVTAGSPKYPHMLENSIIFSILENSVIEAISFILGNAVTAKIYQFVVLYS